MGHDRLPYSYPLFTGVSFLIVLGMPSMMVLIRMFAPFSRI